MSEQPRQDGDAMTGQIADETGTEEAVVAVPAPTQGGSLGRRIVRWPLRRYVRPRIDWGLSKLDAYVRRQAEFLEEALSAVLANQRLLNQQLGDFEPDYQIPPLDRRGIVDLRWSVAEFLNWSAGPYGYAAQAGLFVNSGVQLAHEAGDVSVLSLNERLLEVPFCIRALATIPRDARLLDVGGAESSLGFSLAGLGYRVTVVDPRGYPFAHPNLTVASTRLDQLDGGERFDAAIAISTIEHFGLGSYDQPQGGVTADVEAMEAMSTFVVDGGLLVLTVPFGRPSVSNFQRVYDMNGLQRLIEGWEIDELVVAWRRSLTDWELGSPDEDGASEGVAMIAARSRSAH